MGGFGSLQAFSIGRMPRRKPCDPDTCPPLQRFRTASSHTGQTGAPHPSDRYPPVRPVRPTGQTGLALLQHRLQFSGLGFVNHQGTQWFSGEPPEIPRTRCSLRKSPLMTRLPRSPGSTLVLRLNQERKEKEKNRTKSDQKPNTGKEQDHSKKTSLGPLRQGQRLDTSETKQSSRKKCKPPNQSSNNHKELPLHTCKLPLNQWNSPWTNACIPLENRAAATTSAHTGQTWSPPPVRPVPNMCTGPAL
jgi:hypothetical protein